MENYLLIGFIYLLLRLVYTIYLDLNWEKPNFKENRFMFNVFYIDLEDMYIVEKFLYIIYSVILYPIMILFSIKNYCKEKKEK